MAFGFRVNIKFGREVNNSILHLIANNKHIIRLKLNFKINWYLHKKNIYLYKEEQKINNKNRLVLTI